MGNLKEFMQSKVTQSFSEIIIFSGMLFTAFLALPNMALATSYLTSLELTDKNSDYLKNLGQFTEVQQLTLACIKGLKTIPKELGSMAKLKDLQIDLGAKCSSPTALPETLGSLKSLERLTISGYERAPRFPKSLSQLKGLLFLDLSHDSLTEFPAFIKDLTQLQELRVQWSPQIKKIPDFLSQLKSLRILRLDGNDLTDLPKSLEGLSNLTTITVVHNCRMTQDKRKLDELRKRFPRVFFSFVNENLCH